MLMNNTMFPLQKNDNLNGRWKLHFKISQYIVYLLTVKIKDIKFDEEENYKTHAGSQEYTDGGCEGLVLRRGQPFQVTLTFSRAYDKEADKLILQVYTGDLNTYTHVTHTNTHLHLIY